MIHNYYGVVYKITNKINNQIYIERKIPSEKWQKQYDINMFENSYINMIK